MNDMTAIALLTAGTALMALTPSPDHVAQPLAGFVLWLLGAARVATLR